MKLLPLFSIPLPEKEVDFSKYYKENDKIVSFKGERMFHETHVNWIGRNNRQICSSYYVKPVANNPMNYDKIHAVYCFLKLGNKLNLRIPPARKKIVTPQDIAIQYSMSDEDLALNRFSRKFTTGNKNIDKIIYSLENGYFEDLEYTDTEKKIAESIMKNNVNMGDVGHEYIELIDANHRTLGTILAGEKNIYYKSV